MLSLKTVTWDNDRKVFCSPLHKEFTWSFTDITWASCEKCALSVTIGLDCTCGVYHAPNPEALQEYETHPTSIIAVIKMYGWYDIWSGPEPDLPWTYPTRSQGARIVGVLGNGSLASRGFLVGSRSFAEVLALEKFGVKLYEWSVAREMIQIRWLQHFQIDPYADRRAR